MSRIALAVLLIAACECAGEPDAPASEPTAGSDPATPVELHDHAHEDEEPPTGDDMVAVGCEQGRVDDCVALAERPDGDRSAALAQACTASGRLCSVAGGGSDPAMLERGCRAGSLPACRGWAAHEGGEEARRLGCDAGWLEACAETVPGCGGTLASCVERSRAALAQGDVETAQRLARLGCDGDRTAGCVAWAAAYGEQDPDAAKIALRRACFAEDVAACAALLERDDLTPMERSRADALARASRF